MTTGSRAAVPVEPSDREPNPTDHWVRGIAAEAALLDASRHRIHDRVAVHDRRSALFAGSAFIAVVTAWIVLAPPPSVPIVWFAACVAAHAVAGTVEFEIGPGCALPTAPVQVVMLFLLPPQLVPVAVVAGLFGSAGLARLRDPGRRERPLVLVASAWQVVAPAAVFALAHVHGPRLSDWPVYVVALASQFAFDTGASWIRNCYGLGVPLDQLAVALGFTFLCDAFLAPIGLAAVLTVPRSPGALLFLPPPTALLAMLQSNRRNQIDKMVALGAAFIDSSDLARRDALTGVANRLAFEEVTARYKSLDAPMGVILADVDGLKSANDTRGHTTGDHLLIAVATTLERATTWESGAVVFRIGGDEFAILLPDGTPESTNEIGAALQAVFRSAPRVHDGVPVSASIGVGFAPTGSALGAAIAHADRGVHADKDSRDVRRR
jgi:diguanylate cyclase (GGDEF)-like protein